MVEFVLVLPLVLILLFVLVQMAFDLNRYIKVTDAARIGARAAAVARFNPSGCASGDTTCICHTATQAATRADSDGLSVACNGSGTPGSPFTVTVTVPKGDPSLPFVGTVLAGVVPRTASATEALE
ncbi:MAG TPA: TadE/TadG family type IV pilus assembly protein [Gaiellaceae bacterium]|nr:TadE/TadG family type IV pilus assembly protein [Gaiellaceae bacterium]